MYKLQGVNDEFCIAHFSVPGFQFLILSRLQICFLDFFDLKLQKSQLTIPLLLIHIHGTKFCFAFAVFFVCQRYFLLCRKDFFFSICIQDCKLLILIQK